MTKYQNFVIYSITSITDPTDIYIGSSINFKRRKAQHIKNLRNRASKAYKYPLYQYMRLTGGIDNYVFEIVEKYPCETKEEGLMREKILIEQYNAKLNKNNPI